MKLNVFTALPLELAATAIDALCSSTLFIGSVPPQISPDITKMHFQYMMPCLNYSVPLLQAEKLWMHPRFRQNRKVVILATGWTNTVNDSAAMAMISKAFICRPDVNFVIVDAASYVDTLYKWSALNTDLIGEHIAVGLQHLIKMTPLDGIHLIGHSLGAHIMGNAGRTFKRLTGKLVPRITGLDPAKPCFRHRHALPGLMRGDAKLVDIIHTNIGILAKREPLGDVDFYPGGAHPIQPGCLTIGCSHTRSVEYFAESVYPQQQRNFLGWKCSSWRQLGQRKCEKDKVSTMGYRINNKAKGIYYVDVNNWSPYGRNQVPGQQLKQAECIKRKCKNI
ncbi:LOW QUALITY PROTEIN: vitellogenin-1 [Drosophila busckii]|uniref:LOW QUALITY PROTEIN: vitellogenin-1 n=1 Tax=Drosophila busckii TaxID=30019 RepID=UPI0014331110|nr:LOW QUALITY PROTEIN: vitellogenin-1 [Drosophila busckii]